MFKDSRERAGHVKLLGNLDISRRDEIAGLFPDPMLPVYIGACEEDAKAACAASA